MYITYMTNVNDFLLIVIFIICHILLVSQAKVFSPFPLHLYYTW